MTVTLREVAKLSGVSVSTASAALRGAPVAERTKQHVRKVADRLGYQACELARGLRLRRTRTIGLALPWTNVEIIDSVLTVAASRGYQVLTEVYPEYSSDKEGKVYQSLLGSRVDGVIALPGERGLNYSRVIERFRQHDAPIVVLEKSMADMHVPSFLFDHMRGAMMAWRHLLDLRRHPIVFLGYAEKTAREISKLAGMKEAHSRAGIPWQEDSVQAAMKPDGINWKVIEESLVQVRHGGGIFAASDNIALATIRVANRLGITIPRDVALVGFGDQLLGYGFRMCANTAPTVSAIRTQYGHVSRRAASFLLNLIEKKDNKEVGKKNGEQSAGEVDSSDQYVDLTEPQLVVRQSCGGEPGVYHLDSGGRMYLHSVEDEAP